MTQSATPMAPAAQAALAQRAGAVVGAVTGHVAGNLDDSVSALETVLADHRHDHYWLAAAVIGARLPDEGLVEQLARRSRLVGPSAALEPLVTAVAAEASRPGALREVEVVSDQVLVDVSHTAQVDYTSGIQRVVRQCASRWCDVAVARLVSWTETHGAFRDLDDAEWASVTRGKPRIMQAGPGVLVPWEAACLIPELVVEPRRVEAVAAMARFARVDVGVIGHDAIPLTTAATVPVGLVSAFLRHLAGLAHVRRVATVSRASWTEYAGWRAMLAGRGLDGPAITPIPLPVTAQSPDAVELEAARQLLPTAAAPLVLVVGSHEPRKNHLAVLHAAEMLWREGLRFSLAFIGSASWMADEFAGRIAELQAAGRPVQAVRAVSDDLLWGAYRAAHFTVFPSLNEGYGLPVAESLASGTPVITSNFGSTAEVMCRSGDPRGGLLVDPHDDHDLAEAMRRLLTDTDLHRRLCEESASFRAGGWDDYADRVWEFLTGQGPDPER